KENAHSSPHWPNCTFSEIRLRPARLRDRSHADGASSDSCVAADLQIVQKIGRKRTQAPSALLQCMSPLLAQSGHFATEFQCPLLGVKRTLGRRSLNGRAARKRPVSKKNCGHRRGLFFAFSKLS